MAQPQVGIIMGSQSDWSTMKEAADLLDTRPQSKDEPISAQTAQTEICTRSGPFDHVRLILSLSQGFSHLFAATGSGDVQFAPKNSVFPARTPQIPRRTFARQETTG